MAERDGDDQLTLVTSFYEEVWNKALAFCLIFHYVSIYLAFWEIHHKLESLTFKMPTGQRVATFFRRELYRFAWNKSQVLWLTHHFFTCFVCKTTYHWYFWLSFVAKVPRFISRSPGGRHSADSSAGGRLAFQGLHRGCGARRTWGFQGLSRSDFVKACELQMSHPGCDWDELVEVWFHILYPRVNKYE